ncbi:hypothetical protein HZA97_01095 [Candidatus Woesearchaeota archaeon]|nr:hypothetical protein [Candidatus Woesearchaeota archaeon]
MNNNMLGYKDRINFDENLADLVNKLYDSKPENNPKTSKDDLFVFDGGLLKYSLVLEPYNPMTIFTNKFMKWFAYCQEKDVMITSLPHLFSIIETVKEKLEKNSKIDDYENFIHHLRKNLEVGIITGSFLTYRSTREFSGSSPSKTIPITSVDHYGNFFSKSMCIYKTMYCSGEIVDPGYITVNFEELDKTRLGQRFVNTLITRNNYESKFKEVFDYLTGGKQIVFELGDENAKQLGELSMPFVLKTTQDKLIISANKINPEGFVRVFKWREKSSQFTVCSLEDK